MDIQLRQKFPASPDVSVGPDASEYDVWLRQQFPASPGLSCYPVRLWAQQPASGPVTVGISLGAVEAADTFSASLGLALGIAVTATEAADAFAGTFGVVDVSDAALTSVEASDTFSALMDVANATSVGGARPAGGWDERSDFEALFLRPLKIGRDTVKVDDEQELIEVVAEKITDGGELEWAGNQPVFYEPPTIDWAAVKRMRAQSERLRQDVVIEAIRRVVEAVRDADDDDESMLELMLIH